MFDAPRWDNDPNSPRRRTDKGGRHSKQSMRWFGRQLQRQFDRVDVAKFKNKKEFGVVMALMKHFAEMFNTAHTMMEELKEGGDKG